MPTKRYLAVPGSRRVSMPGATRTGPSNPRERLQVTVVLRQRPSRKRAKSLAQIAARGERLTRAEYEARYGADLKDVGKVKAFARAHKLRVSKVTIGARTVMLSGTVGDFSRAFQVNLDLYEHPEGSFRGRTGPVRVPARLKNIIKRVHGLDNRPQARPHCRIASAASTVSYTPPQVAKLYDFPGGLDGQGQTIGIIELGGGYSQSELDSYFSTLGISPSPTVLSVSVDGGKNQPTGDPNGPDAEVMLDIEVAGGVAPGAKIVVYFAPNTDAGFLDAINQAVMDKRNKPSVISISWGGPESSWTSQSLKSYNAALQAAAAVGVTVCVACGDNGSSDGVTDGKAHVDFPASSPYALACGGTHLVGTASSITDEEVWNDLPDNGATGGGVSDAFPLPAVPAPARGSGCLVLKSLADSFGFRYGRLDIGSRLPDDVLHGRLGELAGLSGFNDRRRGNRSEISWERSQVLKQFHLYLPPGRYFLALRKNGSNTHSAPLAAT